MASSNESRLNGNNNKNDNTIIISGRGTHPNSSNSSSHSHTRLNHGRPPKWLSIVSVMSVFLFSGAIHEAVAYIAMRRTFWPFNTFFLALSGSMAPWWDIWFPAVRPKPNKTCDSEHAIDSVPGGRGSSGSGGGHRSDREGDRAGDIDKANGNGSSCRPESAAESVTPSVIVNGDVGLACAGGAGGVVAAKKRDRAAVGSWRGWGALVLFGVCSMPLTLTFDYMAWSWWRHVLMTASEDN